MAWRCHHPPVRIAERRRGELLLVGCAVAVQAAPREPAALYGHLDAES